MDSCNIELDFPCDQTPTAESIMLNFIVMQYMAWRIRELEGTVLRLFDEASNMAASLMAGTTQELKTIQNSIANLEDLTATHGRKNLTVREAALRARVKPATVRKWLDDGLIEGTKTGPKQQNQWRIERRHLDYFLERNNNAADDIDDAPAE